MLSIMLVTYNRLELTKQTFENLFATTKIPFRLIIVDNGSVDGTINWLKGLQKPALCETLDLILNNENKGIAIGRNQALKKADEYNDEWLCTLDNDVLLPNNALQECIEIIEANPKFSIGVNFENVKFPLITRNGKTFQYKKEGNAGTACVVFARKLHKLLGFFNTEYGRYGEEDSDWGMRSRVVGYEIGYISRMGNHIGSGENDVGEYREFKTASHQANLAKFQQNCVLYYQGKKSFFIPFKQ